MIDPTDDIVLPSVPISSLASSSSHIQVPETPVMENTKKVLKGTSPILSIDAYTESSRCNTDITIRCLPEDSTHSVLGALTLAILRQEDEDNVKLERVSPTIWKCNDKIQL